ncbi:MAG: hypothetical protein IJ867_08430 [Clostridia bacterium]|nr:hypothetical protein [Clostridia bacterium]
MTLQYCSLTSLERGLTGCRGLLGLSIWHNTGLSSLSGIDTARELTFIVANSCDLTDITSLKEHSKIIFLDLAYNTNLSSVNYIQHCKALRYIYLDNNLNMTMTSVDNALNGGDETFGTTVLIANCVNSYNNIPNKYWDLFDSTSKELDWSVEKVGELTVDSAKWVKLKNRSDVVKLRLDNQTSLPMEDKTIDGTTYYGIKSTLKSLTGMRCVSLKNMPQLNDISFVKPVYQKVNGVDEIISGWPYLDELFLMGASKSLVDLSVLNFCEKIRCLYLDNPDIKLKNIQTTINRMDASLPDTLLDVANRWNRTPGWGTGRGLNLLGKDATWDFSGCSEITYLSWCVGPYPQGSYSTYDLTECTSLTYIDAVLTSNLVILPPSIERIYRQGPGITLDFRNVVPTYDDERKH